MQAVGLHNMYNEQQIRVEGSYMTYSSRLATAVTLSSGEVLVVGGRGQEQHVFLLVGPQLTSWQPKAHLKNGRLGHAAAGFSLGGEEVVVVAGGWDKNNMALASVELYSVKRNQWLEVKEMPTPRVDFSLQVQSVILKS